MDPTIVATFGAAGLFVGMLLLLDVGRRLANQRRASDVGESATGVGAIDGAAFGLMGLLIAFTFSGAATRFDAFDQALMDLRDSMK